MFQSVQAVGSLPLAADVAHAGPEHPPFCPAALAAGSAGLKRRASDETTLCSASDVEALLQKLPPTPVPRLQLASLCLARLADPITFTQIFPYVNEMMQDLGVASSPSQVGFYSGLVESVFAVSQLLTILPCARLSDVIGRRPIIIVGVIGVAVATMVFGLSKTFMAVIITRCLAGALAGNVATLNAVLGEITDMSNQAVALPAYGLCWPVGSIIGPLIGGTFSQPAKHFAVFKSYPFLKTYPYFLPCFISGVIAMGGAVLSYFCLEETLPNKRRELLGEGPSPDRIDTTKAYGTVNRTNTHESGFEPDFATDNIHPNILLSRSSSCDVDMFALLAIPAVRALAVSSLALSFLAGAFDVVFVLFCYSPIVTGGLGYPAAQIGYALAIAGTSAALLQLLTLPMLLHHVAPATAYKFCMKLWPVVYLILPFLNVLARAGLQTNNSQLEIEALKPGYAVAVWIGVSIVLVFSRVANLAFSLSMILVKDTSPSPSALGAANGIAQFSMCMARAIAPAFVSALYATSANFKHVLGSYLWVLVMILFALGGIKVTNRIDIKHEKSAVDTAI